jgi:hypothetical protein
VSVVATLQEAQEAVERHVGKPGAPKGIFVDAGDGRWLVFGAQALAVEKDGTVKTPSEVFTEEEVRRLESWMF